MKPFDLYLDKYKEFVTINSIDVDKNDDALLHIDFDHSIKADEEEVGVELEKVLIEKLRVAMELSKDATEKLYTKESE